MLELAHQVVALHALTDLDAGTTVNVGTIEGGSSRNVVPARASATVDLRVVTDAAAAELDAALRATDARMYIGDSRHGHRRHQSAAHGAHRGHRRLVRPRRGDRGRFGDELGERLVGGGSDGNFTAALGVPTLDGLGAVGGGAHALDEHVVRSAIPVRAALLAGAAARAAELGPRRT